VAVTPRIEELGEQHALTVHGEVPLSAMPDFFGRAFAAVMAAVEETGAMVEGAPFGYYPSMPTDTVVVEAGFPVREPTSLHGEVHDFVLPGGRAVVAIHVGPYETMEQTYAELQSWMRHRQLVPTVGMWESYLSDPSEQTDPATWETKIVWPLA